MFGLKELRAAAAQGKRLSDALTAIGIDPSAENIEATISSRLAANSVDPVMSVKSALWDKFTSQAGALKIDATALAESDTGLEDAIDSHARELLGSHMEAKKPENASHVEGSNEPPSGYDIQMRWEALCHAAKSGEANAVSEREQFYAKHKDDLLGSSTISNPTTAK